MDKMVIYNKLNQEIRDLQVEIDYPMSKITSFKVGGPVDLLIKPNTVEKLSQVLKFCNKEKCALTIIGNGTNLLVRDGGIRGIVIQIYDNLSGIQVEGNTIYAKAGSLMSEVSSWALESSLTGLEFAEGIPGTLGGAVAMNAGAYDGEIKDVLKECTLLDKKGEIKTLYNNELEFGYRSSIVQREGFIVADAKLKLKPGNYEEIKSKVADFNKRRRDKQPLSMASGGSTFKRPTGFYAGALIEQAGLRGFTMGNVQVSEKHCGFVVNTGIATAQEVEELIKYIQNKVYEIHGVNLETEVKIIGEKKE
jgi:UDP-N-acetylmuramate dehydrogenase